MAEPDLDKVLEIDRFLEKVPVGASLCLFQPYTNGVALLPDALAAGDGVGALPAREELERAGLVGRVVADGASPGGIRDPRPDVAHASSPEWLICCRLGDGPVIRVVCHDGWLGERLLILFAPISVSDFEGDADLELVILRRMDGCYCVALDGVVIDDEVAWGHARRLVLNIVLVEGLRERTVGAILHGACVERDGQCALLVGESGAGKSTLALGLAANGWRLMTDDHIPLAASGRLVHPFPIASSVKSGSWSVVAQDYPEILGARAFTFGERWVRHVVANPEQPRPSASLPAGLIVVARFDRDGAPASWQRLTPEAALAALLETGSEMVGQPPSIRCLAALVNETPAIALTYRDLDAARGELETLMGAPEGGP